MNDEWAVGQKVVIRAYGNQGCIGTIDRLTNTQVIAGGFRFNRTSGREIGGSKYAFRTIRLATAEDMAAARKNKVVRILSETKWNTFQIETLEKIYKIVQEEGIKG